MWYDTFCRRRDNYVCRPMTRTNVNISVVCKWWLPNSLSLASGLLIVWLIQGCWYRSVLRHQFHSVLSFLNNPPLTFGQIYLVILWKAVVQVKIHLPKRAPPVWQGVRDPNGWKWDTEQGWSGWEDETSEWKPRQWAAATGKWPWLCKPGLPASAFHPYCV